MLFELNELLKRINNLKEEMKNLYVLLNIDNVKLEIEEYELKSLEATFWSDNENIKTLNKLNYTIQNYNELNNVINEIEELIELCLIERDAVLEQSIYDNCEILEKTIADLKLSIMFNQEYDECGVIMSIHAGAGGKEAQDWAAMLYRMYSLWFNKMDFKHKILDFGEGDGPGLIKTITLSVKGKNAYGYLRGEQGVHRLVRVSPFDSSNRRHTSFAAIEVLPEIEKDIELEIRPEDLKIDKYRSSGAGGQHVNTTDSAVRITHLPTGIVTSCQTERSQIQNKDYAMKMLYAKLLQLKEQEHLDKISELKGKKNSIEWGSQIRSYVFMPYQLVKDHRSDYEDANINKIMNGNIDNFIIEYHKSLNKQP